MKTSLLVTALACALLATLSQANPLEQPKADQKAPSSAQEAQQQPQEYIKYEEEVIRKLNFKCSQNDFNSCGLLKVVSYINKLLKKATIELTDDIEIRKTGPIKEELPASAATYGGRSAGGQDDESDAFDLIGSKLWAFVRSRSIKWKFLPEDDVVVKAQEDENGSLNLGLSIEKSDNAVQDGRGKKNNYGPLLAAAVLKIGLIGGLAFKGLALLVGKALLLSKIALLLASIIGLKKLFSHQKHVTYEVVAHPHHTASHSFSEGHGGHEFSGGWARNFDQQRNEAMKMAYAGQAPQSQQTH